MNPEHQRAVLQQVIDIAEQAEISAHYDDERQDVWCGFRFPDGRTQQVFIRYCGQTPEEKDYVCVFSPCRTVKDGLLSGFSKEEAMSLLERNEQVPFARFGIWREGKDIMIVLSSDLLVDTLDPAEFSTVVHCIAMFADAYEEEQGTDEF